MTESAKKKNRRDKDERYGRTREKFEAVGIAAIKIFAA